MTSKRRIKSELFLSPFWVLNLPKSYKKSQFSTSKISYSTYLPDSITFQKSIISPHPKPNVSVTEYNNQDDKGKHNTIQDETWRQSHIIVFIWNEVAISNMAIVTKLSKYLNTLWNTVSFNDYWSTYILSFLPLN